MQHLEVSGAVRPLKLSLGVKWLNASVIWMCVGMNRKVKQLKSIKALALKLRRVCKSATAYILII